VRKIAIVCKKGGVGKTTTAVNLATELSKKFKVLLVDTDPTTSATNFVGLDAYNIEKNINTLLTTHIDINEVITKTSFGLNIIPSHPFLEQTVNGMKPSQVGIIKTIFSALDDKYDFIIFDTPPADNILTTAVLNYVSEVVITIQSHFSSLLPLEQTIEIIEQIKQGLNPTLKVTGILMTMVNNRTVNSKVILAELSKTYDSLLFSTIIEQSIKHPEASLNGVPIVLYEPDHPGAIAYKNFTKELIGRS